MKYTLYVYRYDDEAGYGVVESERFSPSFDYWPESGSRAEPSVKIGEFDTVKELAELLIEREPEHYTAETAREEAVDLLEFIGVDAEDEANDCFYGIPEIYMIWHGSWADPEIMYNGRLYNYLDIEDALFSTWQEERDDSAFEGNFSEWMKSNPDIVYGYLDNLEMLD